MFGPIKSALKYYFIYLNFNNITVHLLQRYYNYISNTFDHRRMYWKLNLKRYTRFCILLYY